jgi:hypothetical protein
VIRATLNSIYNNITAIGCNAVIDLNSQNVTKQIVVGTSSEYVFIPSTQNYGISDPSNVIINGVSIGTGGGNIITNTKCGYYSLYKNTSGKSNTSVGYYSLSNNLNGSSNTTVGYYSSYYASTYSPDSNSSNTMVGYFSGTGNAAGVTGFYNTVVGSYSLYTNTNGYYNTVVGDYSLYYSNNGYYNTAIGFTSFRITTTSNFNVAVGAYSGYSNTVGTYSTYLGYSCGMNGNSSYSTALGYNSTITADHQIVLGTNAETVVMPGLKSNGSNPTSLIVTGTFTGTGGSSPAFPSDYRIKDIIEELSSNTDKFSVSKLRPLLYYNKNLRKPDIGFLAHEVQEFFPYLVNGVKDDNEVEQSLNYIGLIGIIVNDIIESKKQLNELRDIYFEMNKELDEIDYLDIEDYDIDIEDLKYLNIIEG